MQATAACSPETLSLPHLPLPGLGEAEQEPEKTDTTFQTATTTCQEQRSDMATAALHNHAELHLGAGWSSNHLESLLTHCSSSLLHLLHRGRGHVERKRAEFPLQPCPCCSIVLLPLFTFLLSAAESLQNFCHVLLKIPRYPQADLGVLPHGLGHLQVGPHSYLGWVLWEQGDLPCVEEGHESLW